MWNIEKELKYAKSAPGILKDATFLSGEVNYVGSVIRFEFTNGQIMDLRVTEISDIRRSLSYEVVNAEPPLPVTSVSGQVTYRRVT
jgi:hypothetical protein